MTRLLLTGAITTALIAATMTTSAVGADVVAPLDGGERYVALGDSTAAGPSILPQTVGPPCQRSERNFPHLVESTLRAQSFTDATCTGASSYHLAGARTPEVPPQLDALTADTTLVTLGPVGGNDIRIDSVISRCVIIEGDPPPEDACATRNDPTIGEEIDRIGPRIAAALSIIKARSPRAAIVVVGYGTYFPPGGCEGVQPLTGADSDYIQGLIDHIDDVLADAALATGATFADTRLTPGALEHTACAPSERWLEGVNVLDPTARALHPTALGMKAHATTVVAAAQSARTEQQAAEQVRLDADRKALDAEIAEVAAGRAALQASQAQLSTDRSQLAADRTRLDAERARLDSVRSAQLSAAAKSVRGQAVCRGSKVVLRVLPGSPLATGADFRAGSRVIGRDNTTPITLSVSKSSVRKYGGSFTARVRLGLEGSTRSVVVKVSRPKCSRKS